MSRYISRDIQSVTGRNLKLIENTAKLNPWTTSSSRIKNALFLEEAVEVPVVDRWRLPYLCSLLSQRREARNQAMEADETRLEELINSLVLN